MDTTIVIEQMIIIFLLILIGFVLHRTKLLTEATSKQISGIIINVCNPALILSSALESDTRITTNQLLIGVLCFIIMYAILLVLAFLLPVILRVEKWKRYSYFMMTVFGNVGFIGVPLAKEVLGAESLIYVSICNLIFNLIIYTYGISIMKKAAREQAATNIAQNNNSSLDSKSKVPGWINIGTISSVFTIILYATGISFPKLINDTLSYAGRCTTFLSMIVLGVAVSTMNPKKVFTNVKLYQFIAIRLILVPIAVIFIFKQFLTDTLLINSLTVMLAISFGNMSLMFAKSYGANDEDISGGIILSTILLLVTLPLVSIAIL